MISSRAATYEQNVPHNPQYPLQGKVTSFLNILPFELKKEHLLSYFGDN